jgi:hypothetical protein
MKAAATTSAERIKEVVESVQSCLNKASRRGFPYYSRPEAEETCSQTKQILKRFAEDANRNKNIGCFSRVPALEHDVWMIQFLGSSKMKLKTEEDLKNLGKSCYNMDSKI